MLLEINIPSFKRYVLIKISYVNVTFSHTPTRSQPLLPRSLNVIIYYSFVLFITCIHLGFVAYLFVKILFLHSQLDDDGVKN